jgi:hypothetical protein
VVNYNFKKRLTLARLYLIIAATLERR